MAEAGSGSIGHELVFVDARGSNCRRFEQFEVSGKLSRLRAHRELCLSRRYLLD